MATVVISARYIVVPKVCLCCKEDGTVPLAASPRATAYGFRNPFGLRACEYCARHLLKKGTEPSPERDCQGQRYILDYHKGPNVEHTFYFESDRYARAFVAANLAEKKNILGADYALHSPARYRAFPPRYILGAFLAFLLALFVLFSASICTAARHRRAMADAERQTEPRIILARPDGSAPAAQTPPRRHRHPRRARDAGWTPF